MLRMSSRRCVTEVARLLLVQSGQNSVYQQGLGMNVSNLQLAGSLTVVETNKTNQP